MRRIGQDVWYAPTDLVRFLESPFAAWMSRYHLERPGELEPDAETKDRLLFARLGEQHEARHLEQVARTTEVFRIAPDDRAAVATTREAAEQGKRVIYHARLERPPFGGEADFLERVEGASELGPFHYVPVDTKLARQTKPHYLLQLCAYADLLQPLQGRLPDRVVVILGSGERREYPLHEFRWLYERVRDDFLAFMAEFRPDLATRPEPQPGADHGRWTSHARQWMEATDHVGLVAGITRLQIRRLRAHGIDTVGALAASRLPRVARLGDEVFARLREQAALQRESTGRDAPAWRTVPRDTPRHGLARLPAPSQNDVHLDLEGFPLVEGGLEYLFGACLAEPGGLVYRAWWAHDREGERRAFEAVVDLLHARWRADRTMHVYHYAPYEVTALKRLMGRYASREDQVDEFLRNGVFIDLHGVVRHGVRVGTETYSLKNLEALWAQRRTAGVQTGSDSIVRYHAWRESGEPPDPARSAGLRAIQDYNEEDCRSLAALGAWLRERQGEAQLVWTPPPEPPPPEQAVSETARRRRSLVEAMLAAVPADAHTGPDRERWRVHELLAHLVEFHRREDRPKWWARFARHDMTEEELREDLDCLAGLERETGEPEKVKRSFVYRYRFDVGQDTKLAPGTNCLLAEDLDAKVELTDLDAEAGLAQLKFGPKVLQRFPGAEPPARLSLIPDDIVQAGALADSLEATAIAWRDHGTLRPALADVLGRARPRLVGARGARGAEPLVRPGEASADAIVRLTAALDDSTLVVQGPPGSGKTYGAARAIVALVAAGKRVGIAANSHKAILNLLRECCRQGGGRLRALKVGGEAEDALLKECAGTAWVSGGKDVPARLAEHPLVAGTAWCFAHADMRDRLDHLFIDEAGQVSVANLVAMAPSARNLVLIGDQMQLAQPIQGTHPGESGQSTLDYLLQGKATVPPELGVFLPTTRRMHSALTKFISESVYEGRLTADAGTDRRVLLPSGTDGSLGRAAGLVFLPVAHVDNAQGSEEEVEAVARAVATLLARRRVRDDGAEVRLTLDDILFVAPFNLQVRLLRERLGPQALIGSVDRFQGLERPVVILSMSASRGDASTRGTEFLLSRNRLNVAISRAQTLAVVVASPELARTPCTSVEQMALVNRFCRIVAEGTAP